MRVEMTDVEKRFGKVRALDGVSLSIPSGRAVALVGPNGSGKSTLTRALMGLVSCRGVITLDGQSPARATAAGGIAYVPQIAPRFAAPVDQLVRAVSRVRGLDKGAVAEAAARLGLDLAAHGAKPFQTLSGGMKQKLMIALALASPARLLVMDEPTASLDAGARDRFLELFRERREATGATLILCSHRLEEIRHLVAHVVALRDGTVAYDGPAREYLAGRPVSVIEARIPACNGSAAWLRERGWTAGADGWWVKTVDRAGKLDELPAIVDRFGARLDDILVRDLERLEARQPGTDGRS